MTWSLKVPEVPAGNIVGVLARLQPDGSRMAIAEAEDFVIAKRYIRELVADRAHRGVVSAEASGDGEHISITVRQHG